MFPARTTTAAWCTTIRSSPTTMCSTLGQPLFAVAATSYRGGAPRRAPARASTAKRCRRFSTFARRSRRRVMCCPSQHIVRGRPAARCSRARRTGCRARSTIGGQDHFYLEGQIAIALPQEDGAMLIHQLHAASDRSAAHRRARAGPACARHHGAVPAHGRRLRRQGKPGRADRGRRGGAGAQDAAAREAAARSRRRHDHHGQAPRLPCRLRRRLR